MDHYHKKEHQRTYKVELDGVFEGEHCVEAQASTQADVGWVLRRWMNQEGLGFTWRERKYFGKVFIVRVV